MLHRVPLAALAAATLVATSLVAATPVEASASEATPPIATAGFEAPVDTRPLIDQATTVEADEVEFRGTFDGDNSHADFELAIDDSGEGTFVLADDEGGRQELTLDIATATPERVAFTATDPATGQSYAYDSTVPMKRIAFLIPVAFAAIPVATALYYLAIGAAVVIAGVLALEAGKAVGKIVAANNKKKPSDKRDYYPAQRKGSKVMISPKGFTKAQALTAGKARKDVWALSNAKAKALAKDLNKAGAPIGQEKHGAGYLWHYHPYRHAPEMHCFFGSSS